MTLRAIALGRVSREQQAAADRFSKDAQFHEIRSYCERNGIEIVREDFEPGTSAFTSDITRIPALDRAIRDIEGGLANCLIVHESSRLARDEVLGQAVLNRLEAVGARLINTAMGGLDYSTPEGRLIYGNETNLNAYWSRKVSQHSRKGKDEQFRRGLPVGALPFGYRKGVVLIDGVATPSRAVAPVIVPEEGDLVKRAFEDVALGRSPNDIAREWTALGIQPRSVRGVTQFQGMTLRSMLANRFYAGYVVHHGETRPGLHVPIISEELFESAQRPKQAIVRIRREPALLQGLATCAACGYRLYPLVARNGQYPDKAYPYYREASKDHNRTCRDAGKLFRMASADGPVEAALRSLVVSPEWLAYVDEAADRQPSNADTRRSAIEAAIRRMRRDYYAGRLSESEWDELYAEQQQALALLPPPSDVIRPAMAKLKSFDDLWERASPKAKNDACRTVFEKAVLDLSARTVQLKPWPEFEPLLNVRVAYVESTQRGRG